MRTRLKIPEKTKEVEIASSVKTPFYSSFNKFLEEAETPGAKYRVIRNFWPVVIKEENVPDSIHLDLLGLRLSYEFLLLDHLAAGISFPEKCKINLEAARKYDPNLLHRDMKNLMNISLNSEEEKENKKVSMVKFYIEIFENQFKNKLTDEQIAEFIFKKSGNRPSLKSVSSYRFSFNRGNLDGQKSKPKQIVKAIRK